MNLGSTTHKISGPPGCLSGDTVMCYKRGKRNGGRTIKLRDLYDKFNGLPTKKHSWRSDCATYLHSHDAETGRVIYNRIVSVIDAGVKEVLLLRTVGGRELKLTADHPVLTQKGYVQAGKLRKGRKIIVRGSMTTNPAAIRHGRKKRVVVEGLKYYASGWGKFVNCRVCNKTYEYKRQNRARLVIEAQMNNIPYKEYVHRLKTDPTAAHLRTLPPGLIVHHLDENPMNDALENLQVIGKQEHDRLHNNKEKFNVEYTILDRVESIRKHGTERTYDIQMEAPCNNFATADGLLVHNTGKTTYLLNVVDDLLKKGVDPKKIGFVTFTKAGANEAAERARTKFGLDESSFPWFRTLHSMCLRAIGSDCRVVGNKHLCEVAKALGLMFTLSRKVQDGQFMNSTRGDHILSVYNLSVLKRTNLADEVKNYDGCHLSRSEVQQFADYYHNYKQHNRLIDFSDMLWKFVQGNRGVNIDYLIVDEAQDLCRLQWMVVQKLAKGVKQVWVGGDDDQCQPPGTLVETTEGSVPIEKLNPKKDKVLSYCRRRSRFSVNLGSTTHKDAAVYGTGRTFKKARTKYRGQLITVQTGKRKSSYTENHICLAKWSHESKASKLCCVYLMKKGSNWRVGWCQMFNSQGCFHANIRANGEKADALWILEVFPDRTDASVYETVVSVRYGIPQTPFKPVDGAAHLTQEAIDKTFDAVDSETGAIRALMDHGLLLEYPFVDRLKKNYSKHGSTIMEIRACNLISKLMLFPEKHGKQVIWKPGKVTTKAYSGPVYSLAVEPHKTYVADGIITHNCIFAWAGASPELLIDLKGQHEVLSQSYRIPSSVHELAIGITAKLRNRVKKEYAPRDAAGRINRINNLDQIEIEPASSWLFLGRNLQYLESYQQFLFSRGVPFESPFDDDSFRRARQAVCSWRKVVGGELITGREVKNLYQYLPVREAVTYGFKKKLIQLDDKDDVDLDLLKKEYGLCRTGEWKSVFRMKPETMSYIEKAEQTGMLDQGEKIEINTIHGSKGREADNVVIDLNMTNRTYQGYLSEPDNEHRVFYVGVTRARENLFILSPNGGRHYDL